MTLKLCYYRPQRRCQRSWGKVMFSQVSVILFTGGGGVWQTPPGRLSPKQTTPSWASPPQQTTTWNAFLLNLFWTFCTCVHVYIDVQHTSFVQCSWSGSLKPRAARLDRTILHQIVSQRTAACSLKRLRGQGQTDVQWLTLPDKVGCAVIGCTWKQLVRL